MSIIPHELDEVTESPEREHFRVNDDGAAAWAIERLAEVKAEMAKHQALRDKGVQRLDDWLEHVQKPLVANASFFEHLLADYARRQRLESDRKTIALPHGKVSTRITKPKLLIDTERFLEWARANRPAFIRVKEEANIAEMNASVVIQETKVIDPDTGQIIDGVSATSEEMSIKITVNEEENE